jgi:hypothetical protein
MNGFAIIWWDRVIFRWVGVFWMDFAAVSQLVGSRCLLFDGRGPRLRLPTVPEFGTVTETSQRNKNTITQKPHTHHNPNPEVLRSQRRYQERYSRLNGGVFNFQKYVLPMDIF